eukprot:Blabericola_migrator_1__4177@NODE_2279_length_3010_cov_391_322460_g59_i1_p1_GENE_NODE_2279_length_3010_cov_391_322460_g59_i1NODE_2279_length_3010_cov_391_322460_g59_i1_p1_ORF_typecomplete_len703_score113_89GIIM/PF08388_11/0_017RNase_E_G/PF10150_9/8_9RNase_E_G/PF10150_9/6_4CNP1/PF08750_11/0_19DUF2624/PF11116_8/3_8e03DUF2624/PF11116_8/1_3DUF2624/PF11116_8/1_4e04SbiIV/PF11621_8/2_7e02SbiIV/PF11621_8/0_65_NODE_2279_length_3010_cov_391_322460_g59_i122110
MMDLMDLCGVPHRVFRFGPMLNGQLLEEKACRAVVRDLISHFRQTLGFRANDHSNSKVAKILEPLIRIWGQYHDSDTLSQIFATLEAFGRTRLFPANRRKWSELVTQSQKKYREALEGSYTCDFTRVDAALEQVYSAHVDAWNHLAKSSNSNLKDLREEKMKQMWRQRHVPRQPEDVEKRMATYMVPQYLDPELPAQCQTCALQVYSQLPPPNIMRVGIDNVRHQSLDLKGFDVALDRVQGALAAYALAHWVDVTKEEAETVLKIVAPQRVAPWAKLTPMEAWIKAITPSIAVRAAFMSLVFTVTQRYVDSTTAQRLRGVWTTCLEAFTQDPQVRKTEDEVQSYLSAGADIVTPAVSAALEDQNQVLNAANDAINEASSKIKSEDSVENNRQALKDAVAEVVTLESVPRGTQELLRSRINATVKKMSPDAVAAAPQRAAGEALRHDATVAIDDFEKIDVVEEEEEESRSNDVETAEGVASVTPELFANFARKNYVRLQGNKLTYTFFDGSTPCTSVVQPLRCNMRALIAKTVDERQMIASNPDKSYIAREDVVKLLPLALDTDEVLLEIAISQAFEDVCPDVSADRLRSVAKSMGLLEEMPDDVYPSALAGLILFYRCFERHLAADPYLDQVVAKMPQSLSVPFAVIVQTARRTRIPSRHTKEFVRVKLASGNSSVISSAAEKMAAAAHHIFDSHTYDFSPI